MISRFLEFQNAIISQNLTHPTKIQDVRSKAVVGTREVANWICVTQLHAASIGWFTSN